MPESFSPIYFDKNERNYMKTGDVKEVNVDTINFKFWTEEMKDRLMRLMELSEYSERGVELARKYKPPPRWDVKAFLTLG